MSAAAASSGGAGNGETPAPEGTGTLRVNVASIVFDRADGQPEDDVKTWIHCVVLTGGKPNGRFWYSNEAEVNFGKTAVANGNEGAYNFVRNSKPIALTDAGISDVVASTLMVHVFKGGNRDSTKDTFIGWFSLDLDALVNGSKLKGSFALQPPAAAPYLPVGVIPATALYTGKVTAEVRPDTALEGSLIGGRVLTLPSVCLKSVPRKWRLPAAEWAEADDTAPPPPADPATVDHAALAAMCDDEAENPYRYVLTLQLPSLRSHKEATELQLGSGSLKYRYAGRPSTPLAGAALAGRPATPGGAGRPATPSAGKAGKPDPKAAAAAKPADPKAAAAAAATASAEGKAPEPAVEGTWQVEWKAHKFFLGVAAVESLQQVLQSGTPLPAVLRRVSTESVEDDDPDDTVYSLPPGKRLLEEDYAYRAGFSLALDSLLLPGVTACGSELNLEPVTVPEPDKLAALDAKAKRDAAWGEYLANKAKTSGGKKSAVGAKSPAKPAPKAAPAKAAAPAAAAKGGAGKGAKEPSRPPSAQQPEKVFVHPYVAAGTVLAATVCLNAPFMPRPPSPPLVEATPADLIPQRGPALVAPPGLDASQEFRREVANAIAVVAEEYSRTVSSLGAALDSLSPDARKERVLAALRDSGFYARMKETLLRCAGRIVRERFLKMPGATDSVGTPGRDEFVSHVYAYLIGQMHAALNAAFKEAEASALPTAASTAASPPSPARAARSRSSSRPGTRAASASASGATIGGAASAAAAPVVESPSLRLRRVALECEFTGHYERAAKVHQSRVLLAEEAAAAGHTAGKYDASVWFDYATFCLRRGEWLKAGTCLRETLSIEDNFTPALLVMGALQCARGRLDDALVFTVAATKALAQRAAADVETIEENVKAGSGPLLSEAENVLPLAFGLHSLVLQQAGKTAESGQALIEAIKHLASVYAERGVSVEEIARSATAGCVYLLVSRFLLDLRLNTLARNTLEVAASSLLDTDAPRAQRVDLLILRARQFLQAVNAMSPRALTEYVASGPPPIVGGAEHGPTVDSGSGKTEEDLAASITGQAYDGAVIDSEQAVATLHRATELSSLVWEAWQLRAVAILSGLAAKARRGGAGGQTAALKGAPELSDLDLTDIVDGKKYLELAAGNFVAPWHCGYSIMSTRPLSPINKDAAADARADAMFASYSGVGGGLLVADEYAQVRLHMQLASVQLQIASVDSPSAAASALQRAKDSFMRAVAAAKEVTVSAPPGTYSGPWSLAWLGAGRAMWAAGSSVEAETVLGEANALDNQNAVVWAWLAYLCCNAQPIRDREAATSLDLALRNNLSGDCTETVVLLHTLADKYRALSQLHVSAGLLRRAVVHAAAPVGASHLDAILHARLALAEVLAEAGALEDALHQYRAVLQSKGIHGEVVTLTLKDSIKRARSAAAAAAATLLVRQGRQAEADQMVSVYGPGGSASSTERET